ncbi:MAG: CDP-diacylglycerol--glycerol-3-phosphate 3-phosphatidyltransferase [Phycisphaerales bacterium]|nr:CDP-diacylglycerol--glycerol-3-phosphate 3-phosphatidyltransferase [Phycisphaerales bacterium]
MRINIPNQITLGRLALSVVFFVLLSFVNFAKSSDHETLLSAAFWVFLVAALTDVLDGWLARAWGQVTSFGRVVDPVVDKVIVCGAFIFFASRHFFDPQSGANVTGVAPWMVIVILLRELLVSAIRSFSESAGDSFAANWVGKLKMFVQSATVCVVLGVLAWFPVSLAWLREWMVWATVIVTAASIVAYVGRARRFMLTREALGGTPEEPPPPPDVSRREVKRSPPAAVAAPGARA